jgi:hypothetical protein
MSYNEKWHIDYDYVKFNLKWTEIKGKQLILEGDKDSGVLIIADEEGNIEKVLGYEKIN